MVRQIRSIGITDLLVLVLLADAAQNAMAAEYRSVTEGVLLCGTILFWSYFLDWLAYRVPWLRRWIEPAPLLLIRKGQVLRGNLRKEMVTESELMSQLRVHGIADVGTVERAFFEPDGQISVIRSSGEGQERAQAKVRRRPGRS